MKQKVAIAGATGYIGRWFMDQFKDKYHLIGLSRKEVDSNPCPQIEWRQVELYSITSTQQALEGVDIAIYLVHSMTASTRLNQGSFEDTDLILADNFVRAAEANGVRQIIYLGGILPKDSPPESWSRHLRSRTEVEQTLSSKSPALTAIRASIIVGPGGSSFDMMKNLVSRLPVLMCPKWTESMTQPISLKDTLEIMDNCLGNPKYFGRAIEIGNPEVMSYKEMLIQTAAVMGKRRLIFSVPIFSVGFSKLWVGYFGKSPAQLVSPLVESLKHTMTVSDDLAYKDKQGSYQSYTEAVRIALSETREAALPTFRPLIQTANTVRSIQRLPNVRNKSAYWVANRYKLWLPTFFRFLITAKEEVNGTVSFHLLRFSPAMLQLTLERNRSDKRRQLFYISGGWLVGRMDYGWLEFREVMEGRYILSAIHEFVPRIPWFLYLNTQARIHLWVMRRFKRYLER
ncbi:MAG: NAD(P)H-binding protein [Lunatimonas sp.]|uniref:NAD(P)H-binding protein n=1 Tax=Lunatimonas sp. TaxID=2060141 RepID=UPI00263AEDF4|nr:NAD(P)H-binding protein [Lunatimonas sp.]MCC5939319.1 NAD(P)H-binding protein [Lunatimonas sp.]